MRGQYSGIQSNSRRVAFSAIRYWCKSNCRYPKKGLIMKFTFVGNFDVGYSSESHHAKTLEMLGHTVVRLREAHATGEEILISSLDSDALIFIHTHGWQTPGKPLEEVFRLLKNVGKPVITYHLDLWLGLKRQNDLDSDPFYKSISHFFTVDKLMSDWFNDHTEVKGHYLPAGVFKPECILLEPIPVDYDIIFVGSKGYHPEWPYRPQLIQWLKETYGDRFLHVGGDGDTGTVRGLELNQIYANAKVSIGDTLCIGFNYPYYWSDRVYETLGRGGFLIHPEIEGMSDTLVGGEHLLYYQYGNFQQLKDGIDFGLNNSDIREDIRVKGHNHIKSHHTYTNRWQSIISEVFK